MLDLVRQRAVSSSQATVHSWWLLLHRHPLDLGTGMGSATGWPYLADSADYCGAIFFARR